MKNSLKYLLFLFVLFMGCDSKDGSLHIITFNIRYDNPNDGINRWDARIPIVESYLTSTKPDIIGMQEVVHNQILDLQDMLEDYAYVGTGREDGKKAGEYSPIFYKKDKLNLIDHSQFWLSETPDVAGSKSWDSSLPRIVTWAQFEEKDSGNKFYAFNTHFDHRGVEARQRSADLMSEKISVIAGDYPVIVTGDFNIRKQHPTLGNALYYNLVGTFKDNNSLVNSADVSKSPVTTGGLTSTGFNPDWSNREGYAIDYIFVNDHFEVEDYQVERIVEGDVFISDHWPVVSNISFKN
ncbi:MAG: endonuclease/exonuclease/phosphatase family protein [Cyclobacteriaceae bacterium]